MQTADPLVRSSEAEVLKAGPGSVVTLLGASAADGGFTVARSALTAESPGVPPHRHHRTTELFFVLDGGLLALVGERVLAARAGDCLIVPSGAVHALAPDPETELLVVATPDADRMQYYRLLERIQRGEATFEDVLADAERFDTHFAQSAVWSEARAARSA